MSVKVFALITLLCMVTFCVSAQVKIGAAGTPHVNAVLELDGGISKGLLLPRLSNTQISDLVSAPNGMIVFSTTDGFLYLRKANAWQKISDATTPSGGGLTLPYASSQSNASRLFYVGNTGANAGASDAIFGEANAGDGIVGISIGGRGGYFSSASGPGGFFTSTTGPALITSLGNVGIGNSNPGYPLDVNGRMRLRHVSDNATAGLWFNKSNNTEGAFTGMVNDSTIGFFGNGTVGNWRVGIDVKNAMLGIGNTDPTAPLSFNNNTGDKMDIYYSSPISRYGIGLQGGLMQFYTGGAGDDIAFGYGSSAAFTERMRIKGNGNVGIGIAPTAKLHVSGNAIVTGDQQIGGVLKIAGGNPDAGDILTAISNDGTAGWRLPNAGRYAFHVSYNSGSGSPSTLKFNANNANLDFIEDFVFNTATQRFTAPADGLYQFNYSVWFVNSSPTTSTGVYELQLYKNNISADHLIGRFENGAFVSATLSGSTILRLNANDQVTLGASSTSALVLYGSTIAGNFFSGYRIK